MRFAELGDGSMKVSVVGLGTWAIGGGEWWGESDEGMSIRAIRAAMDNGINLIDTAPVYGFGHSEEVVGKAIKGKRESVILSTKCGLWWDGREGTFFFQQGDKTVNRCLRADVIKREIERSLKRLDTDYIDIYHTHWQDSTTPIEETAGCLGELQREGKIRAIAVSNATIEDCKAYMATCSVAANQLRYSMLDRAIEDGMVQFCDESNIGILAYSPLEQGLLTGKIGIDAQLTDTEYRNAIPWYAQANRSRVLELLSSFAELNRKYGCTTAQLIIAWTCQQRGITSVLCGARKPENVVENAAAGDVIIEKDDLLTMRKAAQRLEPVEA